MNERIKQLAKQARAWAETAFKHQHEKFTSHWDNPVGYTVTQFFEQKFAELIVRECAEIALKKGMASPDTDFRTGSYVINQYLLTHFGVEE